MSGFWSWLETLEYLVLKPPDQEPGVLCNRWLNGLQINHSSIQLTLLFG